MKVKELIAALLDLPDEVRDLEVRVGPAFFRRAPSAWQVQDPEEGEFVWLVPAGGFHDERMTQNPSPFPERNDDSGSL